MSNQPYEKGAALVTDKWVIIADVPAGATSVTVNYRLVSEDTAQDIKVKIARVPANFDLNGPVGAVVRGQWMQPVDIIIGPNGVKVGIMEDEKVVLKSGSILVARADKALVSSQAHGFSRDNT